MAANQRTTEAEVSKPIFKHFLKYCELNMKNAGSLNNVFLIFGILLVVLAHLIFLLILLGPSNDE